MAKTYRVEYTHRTSITTYHTKGEDAAYLLAAGIILENIHDMDLDGNQGEYRADIAEAVQRKDWEEVHRLWQECQIESAPGAEFIRVEEFELDTPKELDPGHYCGTCAAAFGPDDLDGGRCTTCLSMIC